MLVASGAVVLHEEPLRSEPTQTVAAGTVPHAVYRTGGDGVWLHESPGLAAPLEVVMPDGAQFNVDCFVPGGDNVNGNHLWLQGDYNGTPGAVTDYYIDTHWSSTQDLVNQGIEQCGSQPDQSIQGGDVLGRDLQDGGSAPDGSYVSAPTGCYFNFKWPKNDLTFSYEGDHRYYGNAWQAAKNWTDLDAGISIKPAPEGEEGDIVFRDVYKRQGIYGEALLSDDYMGNPDTHVPSDPRHIGKVYIEMNQYAIEDLDLKFRLDDHGRTYTATHEMGHALGFGHPNGPTYKKGCGLDGSNIESIMEQGSQDELLNDKLYNTPQDYDKIALRALYAAR